MTICQGQHTWEAVYRHGPEMEETVVRWCSVCGAIVIDIDVDGRTQPGGVMAAKLPWVQRMVQGRSER